MNIPRKTLVLLNVLLFILSCAPQNKLTNEDESQLDSIDRDNQIYTVGTKLLFDYYVIDRNKDTTKVFLLNDMPSLIASSYILVDPDTVTNRDFLIDKIHVEVQPKPLYKNTEHPQTRIQFDYLRPNGSSVTTIWTGIIEDKSEVWWHPPRQFYFFSTEFNPFPTVRYPLRKGKKWKSTISVGNSEEVKQWVGFDFTEKILDVRSEYKITETTKIDTKFGLLKCYVIESKATSKRSDTTLTAYFHPELGFIKWDYFNINETRLVMELVSKE